MDVDENDEAESLLWRAISAASKKDFDLAVQCYTEAIRLKPDYHEAYNNRGCAWRKKGDYDRAIADFTEAIRIAHSFNGAFFNRGLAHLDKDDFDNAIKDFTEAIRFYMPDPENVYLMRGLAYQKKGDTEKAIADNNEAIRLNPDFAAAYNNRGELRDGDDAIADYTEAIRLDPTLAEAHLNRSIAYRKRGEDEKADADQAQAERLSALTADPPKPPELKVLEKFIGTWDCDIVASPAIWTPREKQETFVEINEMVADGWFLHGIRKTTDGMTFGIVIRGYDSTRKAYRAWRFFEGGSCEVLTGQWDVTTSTLLVTSDLGDGIKSQAALRVIDKDHHEYRVISKDDDGNVYLDARGTLTRRM